MKILTALLISLVQSSFCHALPVDSLHGRDLLKNFRKNTSFEEVWLRSPTPDAIIKKLHQDFPLAYLSDLPPECKALTRENRSLLGDSDPVNGLPAVDKPNSTFVNWYQTCLVLFIKAEDKGLSENRNIKIDGNTYTAQPEPRKVSEYQDFYTPEVIAECKKKDDALHEIGTPDSQLRQEVFRCQWKVLSPAAKAALVEQLLDRYIGPKEVRVDLGVPANFSELVIKEQEAYLNSNDTRYDFLLNTPGQRGTVRSASSVLKFLIHFTGTGLKY